MTKFIGVPYAGSEGKITYIFEGFLYGRENEVQVTWRWISVQ